ncbi:hypothetical protein MKY91_20525 [Alkalicoccobacillus gibsonii]|uniref:Uncharacterized protein n=1 Tax=Alkalicoccobacillus gibsonii TaxID=79881 RepID=A0ABU9VNR5_9BACI
MSEFSFYLLSSLYLFIMDQYVAFIILIVFHVIVFSTWALKGIPKRNFPLTLFALSILTILGTYFYLYLAAWA